MRMITILGITGILVALCSCRVSTQSQTNLSNSARQVTAQIRHVETLAKEPLADSDLRDLSNWIGRFYTNQNPWPTNASELMRFSVTGQTNDWSHIRALAITPKEDHRVTVSYKDRHRLPVQFNLTPP